MATTPYTITAEGLTVTLERNLARDVAVPGTAKLLSMPVGQVFSRRLRSQSFLPNLHLISNTIGFPDEPARKPNVRLNIMPITPEVVTTSTNLSSSRCPIRPMSPRI